MSHLLEKPNIAMPIKTTSGQLSTTAAAAVTVTTNANLNTAAATSSKINESSKATHTERENDVTTTTDVKGKCQYGSQIISRKRSRFVVVDVVVFQLVQILMPS